MLNITQQIAYNNDKHAYARQPSSFTHLSALVALRDRGNVGPVN